MKKVNFPARSQGYAWHDYKIQHISIKSITIPPYDKDGNTIDKPITISCELGGEQQHLQFGNIADIPEVHATEDDCANNANGGYKETALAIDTTGGIRNDCAYCVYDGDVKCIDFSTLTFVATPRLPQEPYRREGDEWLVGHWHIDAEDCCTFYYSEELAKATISIDVVEQDGTMHKRPSLQAKATLTEEQRIAWENLIDAFDRCERANVKVVHKAWSNDFYAVNGEADVITYAYDADDDYKDITALMPLIGQHFEYRINDMNDCEDGIFIR